MNPDRARRANMRRVGILLLVIFCGVLASCMPMESVGRTMGFVKPKQFNLPKGPDTIWFAVAPVNALIGDRYVNQGVWTDADEQVLPAATRLRLQENGFRVGLIVSGRTPDGLQQLLDSNSKKWDDQSKVFQRPEPGATKTQLLVEFPRLEFPMRVDEQTEAKAFDNAKCRFEVLPNLDGDLKVRLLFTPQIEFDDNEKWKRLNPDRAISVQGQRSNENIVPLQFEMSLGANDFVVIGGRYDKPDSLGFKFFVNPNAERPAQRLMVVRAGRLKAGGRTPEVPKSALAAQAAIK